MQENFLGTTVILPVKSVRDTAAFYKELITKEVEFVGDLSDREYGCRDFRVKDNNGNMLIIGHALDNQSKLLKNKKIA